MHAPVAKILFGFCSLLIAGCTASVSTRASSTTGVSFEDQDPDEVSAQLDSTNSSLRAANARSGFVLGAPYASETPDARHSQTMLGARHDLKLAAAANTPSCSCLAIALGQPADPAFDWLGEQPALDPATQLVLAFSSRGVPCAGEPEASLGASYWGYKWKGQDVVVVIEPARAGRPITTGAIIPRPVADGRVVFMPDSKGTPYGRPLSSNADQCAVRAPGPARTTPPRRR